MSFDSVSSIQRVKAKYDEIAKKILIDKSSYLTLCILFLFDALCLSPQLWSCRDDYIGLDKHIFGRISVKIFLPITFNICFGCSKEPPQHMFWLRNKKANSSLRTLN